MHEANVLATCFNRGALYSFVLLVTVQRSVLDRTWECICEPIGSDGEPMCESHRSPDLEERNLGGLVRIIASRVWPALAATGPRREVQRWPPARREI